MKCNTYLIFTLTLTLIEIAYIITQAKAQNYADEFQDYCQVIPICGPNQKVVNCQCVGLLRERVPKCPPGTILVKRGGKIVCYKYPVRGRAKQCEIACQLRKPKRFACSCKK